MSFWDILEMIVEQPVPQLQPTEFSSEFCDFISLCLRKDPTTRPSSGELLVRIDVLLSYDVYTAVCAQSANNFCLFPHHAAPFLDWTPRPSLSSKLIQAIDIASNNEGQGLDRVRFVHFFCLCTFKVLFQLEQKWIRNSNINHCCCVFHNVQRSNSIQYCNHYGYVYRLTL